MKEDGKHHKDIILCWSSIELHHHILDMVLQHYTETDYAENDHADSLNLKNVSQRTGSVTFWYLSGKQNEVIHSS